MSLVPLPELVAKLGLSPQSVEPFGWHVGKLDLAAAPRRPNAKYVLVTAMTPTPLGEGKTVVTIGLAMGLCRLGHSAIATLREPSRAPVFGVKGGGAGGGSARVEPATTVNLGLTGDLSAVAAAHNLCAAMVDSHLHHGLTPLVAKDRIAIRRVIDVSDRALASIFVGRGEKRGPERESGFELTAASEVMAILALASSLADLRQRLGRMIVAYTPDGERMTTEGIGAAGAMAALLRNAIRPNLVQTSEGTPAFVHAGPFANIAHGCSSVVADHLALGIADWVVTEAGFGSDAGAEKFVHIKCRTSGLRPDVAVLVCTVRALKAHGVGIPLRAGRPLPPELARPNLDALRKGAENLHAHIQILRKLGLPVVVAVNRFPDDSELELAETLALASEADAAVTVDTFARGGEGALELGRAVESAARTPSSLRFLYELADPIEEKLRVLAREVYGAADIELSTEAQRAVDEWRDTGLAKLPVCVAKTQYSLSHDPARLGRPTDYVFPIRELRASAGAGFVYALAGAIGTMPGLPKKPAATHIDIDADGNVTGMS
jgi:formate--tetrahydrofolate ligase